VLTVPDGLWVTAYRCSNNDCRTTYLEVKDMRWVFPLQETFPNIPEELMKASPEKLKEAQLLLYQIDYKTVSIVAFENLILGVET